MYIVILITSSQSTLFSILILLSPLRFPRYLFYVLFTFNFMVSFHLITKCQRVFKQKLPFNHYLFQVIPPKTLGPLRSKELVQPAKYTQVKYD